MEMSRAALDEVKNRIIENGQKFVNGNRNGATVQVLNFRAFQRIYLCFFGDHASLRFFAAQNGKFNDVSFGITVYIRKKNDDNTLEGIILNDQRKRNSRVTLLAEKAKRNVIIQGGSEMLVNLEGRRAGLLRKRFGNAGALFCGVR